jgi:hypothetical protein
MARLVIKTAGLENRTLELRLGVNHVGRNPNCDFTINHPGVSSFHCEIELSNDGVFLRDCGSTNGTFVNEERIKEAWLRAGQTVRFSNVELFVESTDITISIPKFERERPKPPVVVEGGIMLCPRHPSEQAIYKCTHCSEIVCGSCVHVLRRQGGQTLRLCPLCSHKCEPIQAAQPKKKKGILGFFDTVKLKFKNPREKAKK